MRATMLFTLALVICLSYSIIASAANINITYNIDTDAAKTPISKYIYGSNWGGGTDYTVKRSGGNRLTAYNWENNWSNAGADWYFENDQYMSSSTIPGKAITDFRDSCIANKQDSIVTLQMADYVSAAIFRQINLDTEAAPSIYFKNVIFAKGAPFCSPADNPDGNDPNVYMDEFVNFLVSEYGHAGEPNGVKFYCMDNEPDIWSDGNKGATHPEVHPAHPTCTEYKDKSVELSIAVKNIDPNAQMLGPVSYGFIGYLNFQGAPDWAAPLSNGYNWFLDYYLDKMEANSVVAGKRLLDALDVHWYPEAQDGNGNRITTTVNTAAMYNARMQAPRSLWDYDYHEISWIEQWFGDWLPILPPLKNSINNYYPDTNLSITEYDYGGQTHWSGGIATSDALGIFGKYGVYLATYWGDGNYVDAAIKLYRNYDGNNSTFGDMSVPASMSNKVDSSIYASASTADANALHLIVINKNIDNAITGTFSITGPRNFVSGRVWHFDNSSPAITETTAISVITDNAFTYTIPPMTICHIVLQAGGPSMTITKCRVTAGKTQYHNDADYNDMKDTFEASGTVTLPGDCNDINSVEVTIISATDGNVIYTETLSDFNPTLVNSKGKYTHKAKASKGQVGKITSLTLDFRKRTFAIKAKNIDLTGLASPVQLGFNIRGFEVSSQAEETVVNGSKKSIPTRLMRTYKDTLIVTKAKVKDSANAFSDSLSVKGDIAVADMNLDTSEPNLVNEDVVITWGDVNDTSTQTFTIPAGSFKASKKGHLYKCGKINPVISPLENANTLVTATIDLDKCTFTLSIIKADLDVVSGDLKFSLNFAAFDETDDLSL